ncbi:MAG: hypothetical protein IKF11_06230 [Methanobrevibacter sp.]|nr:hypothetical protein [Methanobrevibacter sp.]
MEKIIVNPEKVRGLGNILFPKSLEDFETYLSKLTSATEDINDVSNNTYVLNSFLSTQIILDAPEWCPFVNNGNIEVNFSVKGGNRLVKNAAVKVYVNDVFQSSYDSESSGTGSFNVVMSNNTRIYGIKAKYNGTTNYGESETTITIIAGCSSIELNISGENLEEGGYIYGYRG